MGKRGPSKGSNPFKGGGSWRDTSYGAERELVVAWMATPPALREPSTQKELAEAVGVSQTTISNWVRDPSMARRANRASASALAVMDIPSILAVQVGIAKDPLNRSSTQAARLVLEYADKTLRDAEAIVSYQDLSDEELRVELLRALDEFDERTDLDLEAAG